MIMNKRLIIVYLSLCCAFFVLVCRLVYISTNEEYVSSSKLGKSSTLTLPAERGTIYDRYLTPLTNSRGGNIYAISPLPENIEGIKLLQELSAAELSEKLKLSKPFLVESSIFLKDYEGIYPFTTKHRYQSPQPLAHLIGYLSDSKGVSGIEKAYDDILKKYEKHSKITFSVDAKARTIDTEETKVVIEGNSDGGVVLTVHKDFQRVLEEKTAQIISGAALILDATSGDILGLVSLPSFSPDDIASALENPNAPLVNKALCNYDLGSVFKLLVAGCAVENGFDPNTMYNCLGQCEVLGKTFKCHKKEGHGNINLTQAISYSCNTYFINMALKIPPEKFVETGVLFGFDRPIEIAKGLSSDTPVFPQTEDLNSSGAVANFSFGQGNLMASPLHVAKMLFTIINYGNTPDITCVLGEYDGKNIQKWSRNVGGKTNFSKKTCLFLINAMRAVTEYGTGVLANSEISKSGGKTGTAETGILLPDGSFRNNHWFAGFYPSTAPAYIVVVLSEYNNVNPVEIYKNIVENLH